MIIYQVFTRLFGNRNTTCKEAGSLLENGAGHMSAFTPAVLRRIKGLGATHVWYTGIIRHASATDYSSFGIPRQHPAIVKGVAGSPYAITDYYDVDPDLADDVAHRMEEFEALVARTHKAGLKVIIDFVPNHVARQYKSVARPEGVVDLGEDDDASVHYSESNNFYYCVGQRLEPSVAIGDYEECPAKATGNDHFDNHPSVNDWYETVKLNYGAGPCDTWHKMGAILAFWASKGVDAFRCDMAEMVPSAFWAWVTAKVRADYPHILFIGEVYNPSLYRTFIVSGFDYLYDKVGMYDCVRDVICGHRWAADITHQWQATDDIRSHMLYFLENHDEQRVASDFFAGSGAKGVPGLIVSALMWSNPFMIYAGQEYGERGMDKEGFSGRDGRTTIFDYWTVGSLYRGFFDRRHLSTEERSLEAVYQRVLTTARALDGEEGPQLTFDLMYVNGGIARNVYAFLRRCGEKVLLVAANFSDEDMEVEVVIPAAAFDYLSLEEGSRDAINLLAPPENSQLVLVRDKAVRVSLRGRGGVCVCVPRLAPSPTA